MLVLGISGKKQSGKTTAGNFILSLYLAKLNASEKLYIDDDGNILISDLCGDKSYEGIFSIQSILSREIISNDILLFLEKLQNEIKIYNFADILKIDICMNILGLTYDQCYGSDENKNELTSVKWPSEQNNDKSNKFMTAREVMQYVGTDIFRKMDTDVWVKSTINKILKEGPELAIITDCRFPNEVEAIKNIGGKVLRLTRSPFLSDHISETVLDKESYDWNNFDYIINNDNHNLYDQFSELKTILEKLLNL
jgi:hypothetical protein